MLKTKRPLGVDDAFASPAESASANAANHALMAETADAALQPRGAPVVSPRIFKGVGCWAEADPTKRSPETTAVQNIRTISYPNTRATIYYGYFSPLVVNEAF